MLRNWNSIIKLLKIMSDDVILEKGEVILRVRKEQRDMEIKLREAMFRPFTHEWMFWVGLSLVGIDIWLQQIFSTPARMLSLIPGMLFILSALESASMKRAQALLDWIEYQTSKDKPQN